MINLHFSFNGRNESTVSILNFGLGFAFESIEACPMKENTGDSDLTVIPLMIS